MASGTIKKPSPGYRYTSTITSGTGNVSIMYGSIVKVGKLVSVSARIKANQILQDAMNIPLVFLEIPPMTTFGSIPSVITVVRQGSTPVTYSGLVKIIKMSNSYYAAQQVSTVLQANDEIEMYFNYPTDEE